MLYNINDTAIRFDLGQLSKTPSERELKRKEVYLRKKAIKEALDKGHKICTECQEELPLSMFNVDKKTFTGYSSWCKGCKKEYNRNKNKGYGYDEANGE